MLQPAFDHGLRAGLAVFLKKVLFQTACIHADAHGAAIVLGGFHDLGDTFR